MPISVCHIWYAHDIKDFSKIAMKTNKKKTHFLPKRSFVFVGVLEIKFLHPFDVLKFEIGPLEAEK